MPNLVLGGGGAAVSYDIDNSVRFNDGDSAYLSRTLGTATSNDIGTFSFWAKLGNITIPHTIVSNYSDSSNRTYIVIDSNNTLTMYGKISGSVNVNLITTQLFRDVSAWYHFVVAVDVTQVTDTNRVKMYVNGSQITNFSTSTYPAQDTDLPLLSKTNMTVGAAYVSSLQDYYDGYLAEFYYTDGTAYDADDFGELDSGTNQWIPKNASGLTFGTNGFYQKYGGTELADSFTDSSPSTTFKQLWFDGTTQYLRPATALQGAGGGYTFSIAWWSNLNESGGQFYSQMPDPSSAGRFAISPGASWSIFISGTTILTTDKTDFARGVWYFHTITRDAGTWKWYVDGSLNTTVTGSDTGQLYNGVPYISGRDYSISPVGMQMVQWATWNTELSSSDVTGLYASGSKVLNWETSYSSGMQSYYTMNNVSAGGATDTASTIYDHSGNSNNATTYGTMTAPSVARPIIDNGDVTNTRAQKKVGDSSIYFDGTGDYLSMYGSDDWDFKNTDGSNNDFTVECWVRLSDISGTNQLFVSAGDYDNGGSWAFNWTQSSSELTFKYYPSGNSSSTDMISESWSPSINTWYHVAVVRSTDSWYLWVDGSQVGSTVTDSDDLPYLTSELLYIGAQSYNSSVINEMTGYMDELRLSRTARYTSSFTPQTTEFATDSNTKLLIHSNWDGGFGGDSSGNHNNFAATNLVATDQMPDTPSNNWCTFNSTVKPASAVAYSEGNLAVTSSATTYPASLGTMGVSSGKWYFEVYLSATADANNDTHVGWVGDEAPKVWDGAGSAYNTSGPSTWYYSDDGEKNVDGTSSSYGNTFTTGDIIGATINFDDDEIKFYKNNTVQNSGTAISFSAGMAAAKYIVPGVISQGNETLNVNFGQDSSFAGTKTSGSAAASDDNGVGDFYYAPPTDYLALCTDNLSDPEIALPGDYFNTVLYTGDGNTGRSVTGTGFSPGFLWIKNLDAADKHINVDSVRGPTIYWSSNTGGTFTTDSNMVTSLDSDGFTIGDEVEVNTDTEDFVSWNWLCGDSFDPTTGSTVVTATGNANTTAGISVVKYVGPGDASDSFAHGLSQAVEFAIIKADAGDGAATGATPMTWDGTILISGTSAFYDSAAYWRDTAPDASLVYIGTAGEVNDGDGATSYSAYCFHSVEGYSKVGSYTGNGNVDGTFVYTGFQPAYVFIKKYSAAGDDWYQFDAKRDEYNPVSKRLVLNGTQTEGSGNAIDFLSNGIKIRESASSFNGSGTDMIYMAFAESPFKYSNAR